MALPYNIETNVTYRGVRSARIAFDDTAAGNRLMCLVCGTTGIGKSLEARRALRKAKVAFEEFGITPNEYDLVKNLWSIASGILSHRGRRIRVVIADDKDGIAKHETILNHLKNGFGADSRQINFPSDRAYRNAEYKDSEDEKERKKYRASIPLPRFDLDVRLIWLSNINFTDPEVTAGLPVHFHALVSKGLDPIWIDVDIANDGRALFLYVHWLATEKNSLGGEGYTYDVARAAVRFYVENVHRLIDIPPRRLSMIAKVIRDNPNPAARDERLEQMLRPTDQRPKLILPESWVPVLLWPANPPPRLNPEPLSGARQPDPVETAPEPEPDPPPAARQPDSFETVPEADRAEMHGNAGQIPEGEGASEPEPVPPLAEVVEVSEPVAAQPVADQAAAQVEKPVVDQAMEPVEQHGAEQVVEPMKQPVVDQAVEPAEQPVVEQVTEQVAQPIVDQTAEPMKQALVEQVTEQVEEHGAEQAKEVDLWYVPLDPDRITLSIYEREKIANENGLKKFRGPPAQDETEIESLRCEYFRRYAKLGRRIDKVEDMKANIHRSFWRSVKNRITAHIASDDSPPDLPESAEADALEDPLDPTGTHDTDPPAAVEQELPTKPDESTQAPSAQRQSPETGDGLSPQGRKPEPPSSSQDWFHTLESPGGKTLDGEQQSAAFEEPALDPNVQTLASSREHGNIVELRAVHAPDPDPLELSPNEATDNDMERATFLLNTPLPALGLQVAETGDEDFAQLIGEPASVESASLVRHMLFGAVAELARLRNVPKVRSELHNYLRSLRSTKFWLQHSNSNLSSVVQAADKQMRSQQRDRSE